MRHLGVARSNGAMSILALGTALLLSSSVVDPPTGVWRAWLDSPGGELPFGIELTADGRRVTAALLNGHERIEIPSTLFEKDTLVLDMPHYDSRIEARLVEGRLDGTWRKRRGADTWTEMEFHAVPGPVPRFRDPRPAAGSVDGRWAVRFESSSDLAVGLFESGSDGVVGTVLTTTGDYRYLAGDLSGDRLRLSCFDGAHAFLLTATLGPDGALNGDFWSRESWHETWTARRDPSAALPDPYRQTTWNDELRLDDLVFPDLDGTPRSLADPAFAGKARILQVFGTWCPNCHDETRYLVELDERYGPKGLSILGLAFELTGELERDANQVRRFQAHHGVRYPMLVAGPADKEQATRAFPALDFVRSYPTTIFLHADGRVRAVHSGFTGPATGEAYAAVREEFESLIEELLSEPRNARDDVWAFLRGNTFEIELGPRETLRHSFVEKAGRWVQSVHLKAVGEMPAGFGDWQKVRLSGPDISFDDEQLRVDLASGVLLDPRRFERRFVPAGSGTRTPSIDASIRGDESKLVALVKNGRGAIRREAIVAVSDLRRARGEKGNPHVIRWLLDDSPEVVLAATWAAGVAREAPVRTHIRGNLTAGDPALRRESVLALGRLGLDKDRRAIEALLDDPDALVRAAAAEVLGIE
jgi:thiol-disulfide isomerase/thioredoxin